jgi:hypothetical protein
MNMPGFYAESSLSPTSGIYRERVVLGKSGTGEVLPMQEFLASSTLSLSRLISPWPQICCFKPGIGLTCRDHRPFESCECIGGFPVCRGPVVSHY